jgi:hypothetical protein
MRVLATVAACYMLAACNPTASLQLGGIGWEDASHDGIAYKVCRSASCGGAAVVSLENLVGGPILAREADLIIAAGAEVLPISIKESSLLAGLTLPLRRRMLTYLSETIDFESSVNLPEDDPLRVFAKGETVYLAGRYTFVRTRRRSSFAAATSPARAWELAKRTLIAY